MGEQVLEHVDEQMVRMAAAFLGGVGSTHEEMCGALSAGVMLIGALRGPRNMGDDDRPMRQAVAHYRDRFIHEIGPTKCGALRDGLYGKDGREPCSVLVQRAARILLEVLEQYV